MKVATIGLDAAKNIFQVHGADADELPPVSAHGIIRSRTSLAFRQLFTSACTRRANSNSGSLPSQ